MFVLILLISFIPCRADFVYQDFNETTGLIFVGASGTTNCYDNPLNRYGDVQGKADVFNVNTIEQISENTDLIFESSVETNIAVFNKEVEQSLAGYLHRRDTISAPTSCVERVRLTPSNPSTVGAMWFRDETPVSNGFDTYFTFQISDHSKECTLVKDQYLSQISYRTCNVHGGDGFAFVIQNSINKTDSLGRNGGDMGFGGIENSLAIAFDTWENQGSEELGVDHVSVQSRGKLANIGSDAGLIGVPRDWPLADGKIHIARVTYLNYLKTDYFNSLVASESLLSYLKDNGEQKRIGTLAVFIDDGVATDTPLLALPINLSLLLDMPTDKAFVGFTASTGRFYEKHDLLSWYWCDQFPCSPSLKQGFDYHQTSAFSAAAPRRYAPGPGYGGSTDPAQDGFPLQNSSPDTTPWAAPLEHFAANRNTGLSASAAAQLPPNTLY